MIKKIIPCLIIIAAVSVYLFKDKLAGNFASGSAKTSVPTSNTNLQANSVNIVSTKPDPLDGGIVSSNQTIEITFNAPLQNVPEFRTRMDPAIDYSVELSSDRKIAKITPKKGFELGTTYTLFISPETKFDGGLKLDSEKIFHFRTIKYTGV